MIGCLGLIRTDRLLGDKHAKETFLMACTERGLVPQMGTAWLAGRYNL